MLLTESRQARAKSAASAAPIRFARAVLLLFLTLHVNPAYPQTRRPGDEPYMPTKLEWAALDLQAAHGRTAMTHEAPLSISFIPQPDGFTVLCLLQYTTDYQAAPLKTERDSLEYVFPGSSAEFVGSVRLG